MAKATKVKAKTLPGEDDLLGGKTPAQQAKTEPVVATIPPDDDVPEVESADELDDLLGPGDPKPIKEPREPKVPRITKGEWVEFTEKKTGKRIVGKGVLYQVVRFKGKLYYKEASQAKPIDEVEALAYLKSLEPPKA